MRLFKIHIPYSNWETPFRDIMTILTARLYDRERRYISSRETLNEFVLFIEDPFFRYNLRVTGKEFKKIR
jgi:hypothetical protein